MKSKNGNSTKCYQTLEAYKTNLVKFIFKIFYQFHIQISEFKILTDGFKIYRHYKKNYKHCKSSAISVQ